MHHVIKTRFGLGILGLLLALIALALWRLDWSVKTVAIGAHVVLILLVAVVLWHKHRGKSPSAPPAT